MSYLQYMVQCSYEKSDYVAVPSLRAFIDTFLRYYEQLRLPVCLLASLGFIPCVAILIITESLQALPGTLRITVSSSPCSSTPVRPHTPHLYRRTCVACYPMNGIGSYSSDIMRLNRTARLLSVLRLNLVLPLQLQGT